MPSVPTLTEKDLETLRSEFFVMGPSSPLKYRLAEAAIGQKLREPLPLAHVLELLHQFFMPVGDGYSSRAPKRAVGVPLAHRALGLAMDTLEAHPTLDSGEYQGLFAWARTLEALLLVAPDRGKKAPTAGDVARAHALCSEVKTLVFGDNTIPEGLFTLSALRETRQRANAWTLLHQGLPYDPKILTSIAEAVAADGDGALSWPLDPLTRDATFRAWSVRELAERTRDRSHPPVRGSSVMLGMMSRNGDGSADNVLSRMRLLCLCGIDPQHFAGWASDCIDDSLDDCLAVLLGLGFDPNCDSRGTHGGSLLQRAVRRANVSAIKALVTAGADPNRKGAAKGSLSALDEAKKLGRKGVLSALQRQPTGQGSSELARRMTAALKTFDKKQLKPYARLFAGQTRDLEPLLDGLLAKAPDSVGDLVRDAFEQHSDLFDAIAMILLVRHAGLAEDFHHRGPLALKKEPLLVTGDAVVDGALQDDPKGAFIVVGGKLTAHSLVTELDCIACDGIEVRDFIWGFGGDHQIVTGGILKTPLLVTRDHAFECKKAVLGKHLDDPEDDALERHFVVAALGKEPVPKALRKRLSNGERVLVASKRAKGAG